MGLELSWPVPVENLQQFLLFLHRKGLGPGSIQGKFSALAFHARIHRDQDYTTDLRIKKMIEGWSKGRGHVRDVRTPISSALLENICQMWPLICRDAYEAYEAVLFQAASLLTFFSALRISEVLASSRCINSGFTIA